MIVKAMTFNLRYRNWCDWGNMWAKRVSRVAETVRKHEPAVIGTQEGLAGMLRDLDRNLPEYGRVGFGRRGGDKDEHNAILYRKDLLLLKNWGQFWLSEEPERAGSTGWDGSLPRICTWVHFAIAGSTEPLEFRFYNTHLDHKGAEAREKGAALVWERMRRNAEERPLPAILTGDFNALPGSGVIRFLRGERTINGIKAELKDAYGLLPDPGKTFHGFKGGSDGEPIDYLFGGFGMEPVSVRVDRDKVAGGYPSDHYPVAAEFRFGR